jgi:hypothetical protein
MTMADQPSMRCLNCTSILPSALIAEHVYRSGPVTAIFALDDVPEKWHAYIETSKNYVDGGKFQPDKYQKASSCRLPRHYAWHI